jgi:hypothetical protein
MLSHVACGLPWCGYETVETKVCAFFLEMPECWGKVRATGTINHRIPTGMEDKLEGNFRSIYSNDVPYLDLSHHQTQDTQDIIDFANENKFKYLVFDSWSCITAGIDQNSPKDVGKVEAALKRIKYETGAAIAVVHHSPKGNKHDTSGAKKFKDDFQYRFKMLKVREKVTQFSMDKCNFLNEPSLLTFYIHGNEDETWVDTELYTEENVFEKSHNVSFDTQLRALLRANPKGVSMNFMHQEIDPELELDSFARKVRKRDFVESVHQGKNKYLYKGRTLG